MTIEQRGLTRSRHTDRARRLPARPGPLPRRAGGLAFDFCVRWSAEDAHQCGFEVVVVEDACRGIDVNGSVAETRRVLAALGISLVAAADVTG